MFAEYAVVRTGFVRASARRPYAVTLCSSCMQAARPSVVYITRMQNQAGRGLNFNPAEIPMGSGSGFLWDAAGHVVTNYHVGPPSKHEQNFMFVCLMLHPDIRND